MPNFESGDFSIPSIKFDEIERSALRERGLSEKEIDELEARRNLDLAEEQVKREWEGIDKAA